MPAHSNTAGTIILERAYALGKMLESSGWNDLLRDKITPSDIDLCFDNKGAIIFVDFSSSCDRWDKALIGQRRLYEALVKQGPHCAALCKHNVTPALGCAIDTLRDVDRFQIMVWDFKPVLSKLWDGCYWQRFVLRWMNTPDGPLHIRRSILGTSAGLVRATTSPPVE